MNLCTLSAIKWKHLRLVNNLIYYFSLLLLIIPSNRLKYSLYSVILEQLVSLWILSLQELANQKKGTVVLQKLGVKTCVLEQVLLSHVFSKLFDENTSCFLAIHFLSFRYSVGVKQHAFEKRVYGRVKHIVYLLKQDLLSV